MNYQQIIDWLLEGDVSIQYQVWRDLLGVDKKKLQQKIANEGWGYTFLTKQNADGGWGDRFYQPKWTSTHYTLLDLRNLSFPPTNKVIQKSIEQILKNNKAEDGGIQLGPSTLMHSDICVNGMFLNYASYFKTSEKKLQTIIDALLKEVMPDGGFNCRSIRSGATHSSMHSTISVIEGLLAFQKSGYNYRKNEIRNVQKSSIEFILQHQLFLSDHTGQIINKDFLKLAYPCRWKYDILRALDYFQSAEIKWDNRLKPAIDFLISKRNKDGTWNVQSAHPGKVHFHMEQAGKPSRWNTLRALRVLKHFNYSL